MLNKIKLYIGYWLIMLFYFKYRKEFAYELTILKNTFKVISHPELYSDEEVTANYVVFTNTNIMLRGMVEAYKRNQL